MHPISLQQINTVYWSGFTIEIWAFRETLSHRNIRESLLGIAGVGRCPGSSNRCMFWLANQQAGKYISATELELTRFWPLPLGELVWNFRTQVNYSDIAAYITVFDPSMDKCMRFIPFLVYAMFYPIIASNLMTLVTLIPWYDSFYMHACSPFLGKPFLRWHRTVETELLINW